MMSITSLYRRNVGGLDRKLRLLLAAPAIAVGLFVAGGIRGELLGILVGFVGLVSLLTGITARCPLYVPFGISTARHSGADDRPSHRQDEHERRPRGSERAA